MKTIDQNIPPEYAGDYAKLISSTATAQPGKGYARTRRAAKYRKPRSGASELSKALLRVCQRIAEYFAYANGKPYDPGLPKRLQRAALRGDFSPIYWRKLDASAPTFYTTIPTSVPDLSPPAYAYRDPFNMPTTPTYPPPTAAGVKPHFEGKTTAGFFKDEKWIWARYLYSADAELDPLDWTDAIISVTLEWAVSSSIRPSRPMFAAVTRSRAGPSSSLWMMDTSPPISGGLSIYPRYKPPKTPAPYYTGTLTGRIRAKLTVDIDADTPGETDQLNLDIGPRPMFGRGFNNNTTVNVDMTIPTTPAVYVPRLIPNDLPFFAAYLSGEKIYNYKSRERRTWTGPPVTDGTPTNGYTWARSYDHSYEKDGQTYWFFDWDLFSVSGKFRCRLSVLSTETAYAPALLPSPLGWRIWQLNRNPPNPYYYQLIIITVDNYGTELARETYNLMSFDFTYFLSALRLGPIYLDANTYVRDLGTHRVIRTIKPPFTQETINLSYTGKISAQCKLGIYLATLPRTLTLYTLRNRANPAVYEAPADIHTIKPAPEGCIVLAADGRAWLHSPEDGFVQIAPAGPLINSGNYPILATIYP